MSFTTATITHLFSNADGTPASGSVTFNLTRRMTNGGTTVLPTEVTASLSGSGALSTTLTSNADSGTTPTDAQWRVTFRILGCDIEQFYITVPAGGGTIDLGALLPESPQVN